MAKAKNGFIFKGKEAWSGAVSLKDGIIEEVHSAREAMNADFHHSLYFSEAVAERIDDEESAFFWVDDGTIFTEWRSDNSDNLNLIASIKEQIELI